MYKIQPNSSIVGKNLIYLPSCHSTNDIAKELIQQHAPIEGTVVVSGVQTAGKGLRGNSWEVEAHTNLTFSVILYPTWLPAQQFFNLTVAMSIGMLRVLQKIGIPNAQLKWPNDLYISNKKVGGMLIEPSWVGNQCSSCVVGIGLNVNQRQWNQAPRATSLALETVQTWDLEELLPTILESLDDLYQKLQSPENIPELYQEYYHFLIGFAQFRRYKTANQEFHGQIVGVDEWGRLKMETPDQNQFIFDLKEIEFCWD